MSNNEKAYPTTKDVVGDKFDVLEAQHRLQDKQSKHQNDDLVKILQSIERKFVNEITELRSEITMLRLSFTALVDRLGEPELSLSPESTEDFVDITDQLRVDLVSITQKYVQHGSGNIEDEPENLAQQWFEHCRRWLTETSREEFVRLTLYKRRTLYSQTMKSVAALQENIRSMSSNTIVHEDKTYLSPSRQHPMQPPRAGSSAGFDTKAEEKVTRPGVLLATPLMQTQSSTSAGANGLVRSSAGSPVFDKFSGSIYGPRQDLNGRSPSMSTINTMNTVVRSPEKRQSTLYSPSRLSHMEYANASEEGDEEEEGRRSLLD